MQCFRPFHTAERTPKGVKALRIASRSESQVSTPDWRVEGWLPKKRVDAAGTGEVLS